MPKVEEVPLPVRGAPGGYRDFIDDPSIAEERARIEAEQRRVAEQVRLLAREFRTEYHPPKCGRPPKGHENAAQTGD